MTEKYIVKGVAVTKYNPQEKGNKAPILMVHGGTHAGWCWEKWAPFFQEAGYEVHVLDWFNHGDSDKLPEDEFIKRSIEDIGRKEIRYVAEQFEQPPIVIGHSMGGLASAVYAAEGGSLTRLVLLAPVMPAAARPDPVPLPVDMTKPYAPFPYEQSKQLFYTKTSDEDARRYIDLLVPESAQAVYEATRWTVELDPSKITVPTFVVGDELDGLIPQDALKRYSNLLHAKFKQYIGIGHCDLLVKEPEWRDVAGEIASWLEDSH